MPLFVKTGQMPFWQSSPRNFANLFGLLESPKGVLSGEGIKFLGMSKAGPQTTGQTSDFGQFLFFAHYCNFLGKCVGQKMPWYHYLPFPIIIYRFQPFLAMRSAKLRILAKLVLLNSTSPWFTHPILQFLASNLHIIIWKKIFSDVCGAKLRILV